jgi:hypothetical protein
VCQGRGVHEGGGDRKDLDTRPESGALLVLILLAGCAVPAERGEAKEMSGPGLRAQSAIDLMGGFAERTGVTSDRPQQRYLWTDSFAVCNFLGLWRATGDDQYRRLALRLVDDVHRVLGRHRGDDQRRGYLSRYAQEGEPEGPAATRLAFRELGLAIGLRAADLMMRALDEPAGSPRPGVRTSLEQVLRHAPLRARIEGFWLEPEHRRAASWTEHRDINEVMLASLAPEGCLALPPVR